MLLGLLVPWSASAQGTQTEIDWVEEASRPSPGAATSTTAARDKARSAAQREADSTLRLKLGTSMFSRYELRRNYAGLEPAAPNDRIRDFDAVAYRARMALRTEPLTLRPGVAVDVALVPQASGFWAPSGDNTDAAIALHEGFVRSHFGDQVWLQLGRFEMSYGDEWLIGANGWHETGRSFDGARLHVNGAGNAAFVDVFFNMLREGRNGAVASSDDRIGAGDEMLIGVYGDLGPLIADDLHLDPYALVIVAPRTRSYVGDGSTSPGAREGAVEATLGLRLKGAVSILDYRVEGGMQAGQRVIGPNVGDALAGAVDAELGVSVPGVVRFAVEGLFASGDNPESERSEAWSDRFSQPHKWLGLTDVFRVRSNVMGAAAHISATPTDFLALGLQGHFLFKVRAFDASDPAAEAEARYAGTEVDPYLTWTIAKGLTLNAEYGIFLPNKDTYGKSTPAHFLGVQFGFEYPG